MIQLDIFIFVSHFNMIHILSCSRNIPNYIMNICKLYIFHFCFNVPCYYEAKPKVVDLFNREIIGYSTSCGSLSRITLFIGKS